MFSVWCDACGWVAMRLGTKAEASSQAQKHIPAMLWGCIRLPDTAHVCEIMMQIGRNPYENVKVG